MRAGSDRAVTGIFRIHAVAMFSRRHIDLQRVAGALCPAYEHAVAHSAQA